MSSFGVPITLTCPAGHEYPAVAWRIIDLNEHPELLPSLRDGSIAMPACTTCGRNDPIITESLLLFFSDRARPFVFSPIRQLAGDELQNEVNGYLRYMSDELGAQWQQAWEDIPVPIVQRPNLPQFLEQVLSGEQPVKQLTLEALALQQAYVQSRDPAVLERAIATFERALAHEEISSADIDTQASAFLMTAECCRIRYRREGKEGDFQRADQLLKVACELPANHFSDDIDEIRGLLMLDRYSHGRDFATLSEAVMRLEVNLDSYSREKTTRRIPTSSYLDCAEAWRHLFNDTNLPLAIERSVELLRKAVMEATDPTDLNSARNCLADALDKRHQRFGKLDDIAEAVELFTSVIESSYVESTLQFAHNGRGCVRLDRFVRNGNVDDLHAAIPDLKRAVRTAADDPSLASTYWDSLGNGLRSRYEAEGDLRDLDAAMDATRRSIAIARANDLDPNVPLKNLGTLMSARYSASGSLRDLDQAIDHLEEAHKNTPAGSQYEASNRISLGALLCERYQRTGAQTDIERALAVLQPLLSVAILEERLRQSAFEALGAAHLHEFKRTRNGEELEAAVNYLQKACHAPTVSTSMLQTASSLYATALLERFWLTHGVGDLDNAIEQSRWSVGLFPDDSPRRPGAVAVLAACLRERAQMNDDLAALGEAIALYREASGNLANIPTVLESAAQWARVEFNRENWRGALEPFERLLAARNSLLASQSLRTEKETWLRQTQGAPADAAFAYAKCGDDANAAVALEDGAAILLSEALGMMAREETRKQLSIDDLRRIAADFGGPLVYIAITRRGGIAVIVTPVDVRSVWFPLTNQHLGSLILKKREDGTFSGYHAAQLVSPESLSEALAELMPALEAQVLAPLRAELAMLACKGIALIPAAQLALLPISSALSNLVCVCVQANARSLDRSLVEMSRRSKGGPPLIVGNPLPNPAPLRAAELEANLVSARFAGSMLLIGSSVTRSEVVQALPVASHVHLACHGYSRLGAALDSTLFLGGDERLTMRDFLFGDAAPRQARLVVLSACQSAIPDAAHLPDEVAGLPAAFLETGVPGVIGTLWSVDDLSTALLMDRFYKHYIEDGAVPAEALRSAQWWLRTVTAGELAALFRRERHRPDGELKASYEILSVAWRRFAALQPQLMPFASPLHWAPFVYYGR